MLNCAWPYSNFWHTRSSKLCPALCSCSGHFVRLLGRILSLSKVVVDETQKDFLGNLES